MMLGFKSFQEKEATLIQNVNEIVLNALRVLITAGEPLDGIKALAKFFVDKPKDPRISQLKAALKATTNKLKAAKEIVKGVVTDDDGKGYKEVTMRAFLNGLQTIFKDLYLASKLLEPDFVFDDILQKQLASLDNRTYILKTLGLDEGKIKTIQHQLKAAQNPDIAQIIRDNIRKVDKADTMLRIKFMVTAASCYLPFADLEDGDMIEIPIETQAGSVELKAFSNEKIDMCLGVGDPYFVHLLTPKDSSDTSGQSKMLFMGTNPMPTTKALSITLEADASAGSVGENLINSSQILFEKCIKEQYKANLKKRLATQPNEQDLQTIWAQASIEVSGQSLGGALCLHLGAQYPFMVRMSAFEPALLMEDKQAVIEEGLTKGRELFCQIVDEILQEDPALREKGEMLKKAFPKDKEALRESLTKSNVVIIQFSDMVPQYGTCAPPATFYHVVEENQKSVDLDIIKHKLASHACAFAGSKGVKILKLSQSEVQQILTDLKRAKFTGLMREGLDVLSSAIGFLESKSSSDVSTKRRSSRKTPHHIAQIKTMLTAKIEKKLSIILDGLKTIDLPSSWKRGNHLKEKIAELDALIERAKDISLAYNILPAITQGIEPLNAKPSETMKIYLCLFEIGLGIASKTAASDLQKNCFNTLGKLYNTSQDLAQLMPLYELLDKEYQSIFLDKVIKDIEKRGNLTPFDRELLPQLSYRTVGKVQRTWINEALGEKSSEKEKDKQSGSAKVLVFSDTKKKEKSAPMIKEQGNKITPKRTVVKVTQS